MADHPNLDHATQSLADLLQQLSRLESDNPKLMEIKDLRLRLLVSIGGDTAAAVENAKRILELATLNRIGQELSSAPALEDEEILKLVYEQASLLMDTDNFYAALCDPISKVITFPFAVEEGKRCPSKGEWKPRKTNGGSSGPKGLTEYVLDLRLPVFIPNQVRRWMREHQDKVLRIGRPAKSWLGVPMITRDKVIGVIAVQNYEQENIYDSHDASVLSTIAGQAAIAIENARLLQSTQKRVEELRLLREVGQAISGSVQLDEVLHQVVEGARKVMEADIAALYPYTNGVFEMPVLVGDKHLGQARDPRPRPGGITEQVLAEGFIEVEDLLARPEMSSGFARREEVCSFAGISLRVGGQIAAGEMVGGTPVGVLYVDYRTHHPLSPDERNTMHLFATQAAIAISNARLYAASEQRTQEVAYLAKVGQQILATSGDGSTVLQNLANQALSALGADLVIIYPYEQEKQAFAFPWIHAGEFLASSFPSRPIADKKNVIFRILEGGLPHYAQDATQDWVMKGQISSERLPDAEPFVAREGVISSAGTPLKAGTDTVGLMFVNYRTPTVFDEHRRQVIELFASYAAIAIQNARLFTRRIEEFGALVAVAEAITTQDLDSVLDKILTAALKIVGAPNGNILLVDNSGEYVEVKASGGQPWGQGLAQKFKIGAQGVTAWVAQHKKPALIVDVNSDEWKDIYVPALIDTLSELAVPLLNKDDRLLGVINLESPEFAAFDADDQRLLEALAQQTVIAIQTQQSYEEAQRVRRELEILGTVDRAISSTLELTDVLKLILGHALPLMGAPKGNIMLYAKAKGDLWMAAEQGVAEEHQGARQGLDEGIVGLAVRERRVIRVADVTQAPWDTIYKQFITGIRSELALPMLQDGQLVGVINAESPEVGAFGEADERFLKSLAAQAVVAIQNAERYQRLKALQAIDQAIIATPDPHTVLELILDKALELTGAEMGEVRLVGEMTQALGLRIVRNKREVVVNAEWDSIPFGQGVTGWCIENRQPQVVSDTLLDSRYLAYFEGMRSEIAVPLVDGDNALGALNLESPMPAAFDTDDLEMLTMLAGQAVIALQNARSYAESEAARERFRVLSEVGRALINAPLDTKTIVGIVLETGCARTGASSSAFWMWNDDQQALRFLERGCGEPPHVRVPIKLGEGVNGWVVEHRQICLVGDVENPPPGVAYRRGHGATKSELVVPLLVGERYFGNLDFGHTQKDGFDADEVKLVEGLADHLAVALHRLENIQAKQDAEQNLVAAQEMSSIGQATFELAHRLGNDLGLVKKYTNDVRRELQQAKVDLPAVEERLDTLVADVSKVLQLSASVKHELAEFRRGARPEHEAEVLPAAVLVEDAVLSLPIQAASIRVKQEVATDVAPVRIIHSQIADILRNLVSNAVDAMPKGGTLTIRARNAGRYVEIQVADTGVGIRSDFLPHIFDLFSSTKGSYGFGLWSARRYALVNGGRLTVESEIGQGTTFTLMLPKANGQASSDHANENPTRA